MKSVIIGLQWGDEGKGKVIDLLSKDADLVIRYSGGANAGHTIVHNGISFALHLIPSGIIHPDTIVILGSHMVIDPEKLMKEIAQLNQKGINTDNRIFISDRAHLVLPSHIDRDVKMEKKRKNKIGTTGMGIGIAYSSKAMRSNPRIADLNYLNLFEFISKKDKEYLLQYRDILLSKAINISSFMQIYNESNILLEGSQGVMLDIDVGTYPFVSSGQAIAAGVCAGGGVGPKDIDVIFGVMKPYTTRVGFGPLPTEFNADEQDVENAIRERGREYGTTTGRSRRCGYLDMMILRYSCMLNSVDRLAVTHLDVLDEMDTIKICTGYELDGHMIEYIPSSAVELGNVRPVYRAMRGWRSDTSLLKEWNSFPSEAKEFVKFIEHYLKIPVDIISVGPARSQSIIRRHLWDS